MPPLEHPSHTKERRFSRVFMAIGFFVIAIGLSGLSEGGLTLGSLLVNLLILSPLITLTFLIDYTSNH